MSHAENKLRWCLKKAEKEGKEHRGLRKVEPNLKLAEQHVQKALHNLEAMRHLMHGGFTDWAVNAAFYTLYHCLLSILAKNGYETRNQECTFAAIEVLIAEGKTHLTFEQLRSISSMDQESKKKEIVKLREDSQYGADFEIEKEIIQKLLILAEDCIDTVKSDL